MDLNTYKLLKAGYSPDRILQESLMATRPVPLSSDMQDSTDTSGSGGLLGGILRLAGNLDRPAGAVRAAVTGHNPISGFKDPSQYSLVDPKDDPWQRFLGGAAESVLDPLNLVGAKWMSPLGKESSFITRLAAETGVNLASREASNLANSAIPEDANPWIKGLVPLAAGIAGGSAAAGALHGLRAPNLQSVDEFNATRPTMQNTLDKIANQYPAAAFADRTTVTPTSLEDAIKSQEANARIAGFAALHKPIQETAQQAAEAGADLPALTWTKELQAASDEATSRLEYDAKIQENHRLYPPGDPRRLYANTIDSEEAARQRAAGGGSSGSGAGGTGGGPPGPSGQPTAAFGPAEPAVDPGKNYDYLQRKLAEETLQLAKDRVANLPDAIKVKYLPSWAAQSLNGKINRSPLAHEAASTAHSYLAAEQARTADIYARTSKLTDELFGKYTDKVSLKETAPDSIKHPFLLSQAAAMQDGGNKNWLTMGIVARNQEHFNLSPQQIDMLDQVQSMLKADNNLSRDFFGMKINELDHAYDPRATNIVHSDGSPLTADEHLRLLGGNQSFQMHRMFDKPEDIAMSAANPEYFNQHVQGMLDKAISENADPGEIARLTDMRNSQLKVELKPVTFAEALADRLTQGAAARSESLALKMIRENGGSVKDIHEMESLIGSHHISEAIELPAQIAAFSRQITLSADASVFGSHWIGHLVMGQGYKGLLENNMGGFFRAISSEEGWGRFMASNTEEMMQWANHGLELGTEDFLMPDNAWLHRAMKVGVKNLIDPTTGEVTAIRGGGKDVNALGKAVRKLDEIQYGRMVKVWKLDTARHVNDLMLASRDGKLGLGDWLNHPMIGLSKKAFTSMNDDEIMRAASKFSNNLFGGLNRVEEGRTAAHNMMESLLMLTPGFTRGTLNIGLAALNPLKWDAQAALSRDFALRGFVLAGSVITGLSMAANGMDAPLPNITNPSKDDWMTLKLPGGATVRPFARWRSSGKIAGETLQKALEGGPIEAAQYFGPAALKWGAQRQSGLISGTLGDPVGDIGRAQFGQQNAGNSYAAGTGILNILTNPQSHLGQQIGEAGVRDLAPATLQNVFQTYREDGSVSAVGLKNIGFTIATEFMGVNSQTLTMREQAVLNKGADWAANHGMPADMVAAALDSNSNPLNARDENGRYYFDTATRKAGVEAVAAETGITTDQVYRNGRLAPKEQQAALDTMKKGQIDSFFNGMSISDSNYATKMANLQKAMDAGVIAPSEATKIISDSRKTRSAEKALVENMNPAALAFLQSPDQLAKKNSHDLLMSAISAEYFSKDFYDPNTFSFDFDAQAAWTSELRNKYGKNFDDWQAQADAKKTPLERERDAAFSRLDSYFRVGDNVWQKFTGGQMGSNEKQFDDSLASMLKDQGVTDQGMMNYLISQIKSQIKPITLAKTATKEMRDIMRASNPQLEDDVTKWLGDQPIALKSMSKAHRAYINNLLLSSDNTDS